MASILGNPNVFIESGSVLNLTCLVKHALSKPAFIIWKHGSEVRIYVTPFNDILLGSNQVVYYNIATKTGTLEYFFSPLKIQKLKRKQTIFFKKKKTIYVIKLRIVNVLQEWLFINDFFSMLIYSDLL